MKNRKETKVMQDRKVLWRTGITERKWKAHSHYRVFAAERASEAADLICVCRGEFISNHVYRSALWSCAFGNAQNTFTHLCFVTNYVLCSEDIMFQTGCLNCWVLKPEVRHIFRLAAMLNSPT